MFAKNVYTFRNLPVEEKQRMWTDCCCTILAAIFALTLFIIACASFNINHFYQVNYPVDSAGKMCYLNLPNHPFIYFRQPHNTKVQRYCVAVCPNAGQSLQCSTGAGCGGIVSSYGTVGVIDGLGGICEPTSPSLRSTFWLDPALSNKISSVHIWSLTLIGLIISACVGLVYMIVFIIIPARLTYAVFVLSALTLLTAGILLIVQPLKLLAFHSNAWNIIIGMVLILLGVALVAFLSCQKQEIEVGSIFLQYANNFLKDKPVLFALIPIFMLCSFGLVVLCAWQYIAIGSANAPTWTPPQIYKHIQDNIFLLVLNIIQFVWGIQFIRDSFNYIISGNAVQWYFSYNSNEATSCCRPITRYFCKNFGSVIAGSFLNAFLNILCIIFDLFRCDPKGKCGKAGGCCRCFCCCCSLIDLSRADAYAYIHLSGIPYCNAARQCQAICLQTNLFYSDDTCIRLYRIAAQIFVVTLSVLITLIVIRARTNYVSMFALGVLISYCYLMATHFVDIHSNGAQALVTCYLTEANCEGEETEICPQNLRNDVYNFQKKYNLVSEWTA